MGVVQYDQEWALCEVTWRRGRRTGAFVAVRQGVGEAVAESPRFRSRLGASTPPLEAKASLEALEHELLAAGWERTGGGNGEWYALQFRRPVVSLPERLRGYDVAPDEDLITWLNEQSPAAPEETIFGDEPVRVEAIREAAKKREASRLEAERLEAERIVRERQELLRSELARLEAERLASERRREEERVEIERRELERLEAERIAAELAASRLLANKLSVYSVERDPQVEIRQAFGKKTGPPPMRRRHE